MYFNELKLQTCKIISSAPSNFRFNISISFCGPIPSNTREIS
jgi:hypothetical protein